MTNNLISLACVFVDNSSFINKIFLKKYNTFTCTFLLQYKYQNVFTFMLSLKYFNNNFKIEHIHLIMVCFFFLLLNAFKRFLILNCVEFSEIKLIGLENYFAIFFKKVNHIFLLEIKLVFFV